MINTYTEKSLVSELETGLRIKGEFKKRSNKNIGYHEQKGYDWYNYPLTGKAPV